MIRVAINGFGRIGRVFTRAIQNHPNIELIAINDLADTNTLAHLLKYDSVHRKFDGTISTSDNDLVINRKTIKMFTERDPENLPWAALNIDIVIESTGLFRTKETAGKHITAGAKKVIISAPAKDNDIKTIVLGINENDIDGTEEILSNASCTTNAAAPLIKVLKDLCGVENAFLTTIHSYTNDQGLHDAPHSDLRRGRAGAQSIVPTSTGAATAITKIFPELAGKIEGYAVRVPVADGSLIDVSAAVKKNVTKQEINAAFKKAAETNLKGILAYTDEPLVSVDIIGNPHSCIFDSDLTMVFEKVIKVVGWYDNEAGYSYRLVDLIEYLNKQA
jgi:glyceraldehyde 3-phosphate dehydrogenase (phosphorylating)